MSAITDFQNKTNTVTTLIKDFFSKGDKRSVSVKRNILASFVIRILSILISLVLVPMTISYINSVQYGIWLTLSSIIGWLGYFDVGFGNGLRNRFAESVALGDSEKAKVYVSTTYAVMGIIVMILIAAILIVNPHLDWSRILNAPDSMNDDLSLLGLITIVLFCLQLWMRLVGTVLTANQEPAKAASLTLVANVLSLAAIFVLTKTTSGNIIYLGLALSVPSALVLLFSNVWFYRHKYRPYLPSLFYVDLKYVRSLMGLGIKFFVLQIATLVLYQTSNLIIAHLFGNENVTVYNVAFKYFNVVPMIMLIIMMPLWSAITDAWTKKEMNWIRNTMKKLNYVWLLLSLLVTIMLLLSKPVYLFWVGDKVQVPFIISAVLAISIVVNIGAYIYSIFLNGVGIIKIQLLLSVVEMIVFIPLAIILGKKIGLPGVILATALVNVVNLGFFTVQYRKIMSFKATGIWIK